MSYKSGAMPVQPLTRRRLPACLPRHAHGHGPGRAGGGSARMAASYSFLNFSK